MSGLLASAPAATLEPGPALPALAPPGFAGVPAHRVLAALCVSTFLAALNFFAPTPFYPAMARDLGTSVSMLGQVVTLLALLSAGLGLVVGPLADRYGYRWPLVGGLLAVALNFVGSGLAPSYPMLLGWSILAGVGDSLVFALPFAIAATSFTGAAQRRAIGWTIGALSSAPIVGIPALTTIGEHAGWRTALVIAGLAATTAALFVAFALPPDKRCPTSAWRARTLLEAYAPLLRHPASWRHLGIVALRGMWWLGLATYFGAFLGTTLGLDARQTGLAYALQGGAFAVGSIVAGGRLVALSPRATIVFSSLVAGLLVGPLLLLATAWATLLLLPIVSMAAAVCGVGVTALLATESPAGAGTTMALNGSVLNLGAAAGAAFGGFLIGVGGYAALGIGLPVFALLAAILAWWPVKR